MASRYKKSGWFYESQRHSLARRGIPTSRNKKRVDYQQVIPPMENDFEVSVAPTTIGDDIEEEAETLPVMDDAESVVSDMEEPTEEFEEEETIESPEPTLKEVAPEISMITTIPEEKPTYVQEVDNELQDVQEVMEGGVFSEGVFNRIKSTVKDKLSDVRESFGKSDSEKLGRHIAEIDSQRELIEDKIKLLNLTKKKITSEKYRNEAGISTQITQLDRLNKYIAQLKGASGAINEDIKSSRKLLNHLDSAPFKLKPKTDGIFVSGFKEVFGGAEVEEEKSKPKEKREPGILATGISEVFGP